MLRNSVKKILENVFNVKIIRRFPFGNDVFADIKYSFPASDIKTLFDIGANIGQSVEIFSSTFPKADIYTFEPSSSTFLTLKKNIRSRKNVHPYNLAFSEEKGQMEMSVEENSKLNRILEIGDANKHTDNKGLIEIVNVDTIDNFCEENGINKINFLKVDTEGNDLSVIKGAKKMLKDNLIDFIEVETGMNAMNKLHVPLENIREFMERNNYYLFGIYDQVHEWKSRMPILRRVNPVFLSSKQATLLN